MINDRKRNSTARKRTHRTMMETQKQQAAVLQGLVKQAKAATSA